MALLPPVVPSRRWPSCICPSAIASGPAAAANPCRSRESQGGEETDDRSASSNWVLMAVFRAFPTMSGQRHIGHTLQKRVSNSPLASSRAG